MRTIDMDSWNRREHFAFFRNADLPFYNVNVAVGIGGLPEAAKARGLSFNSVMMFLTLRAMNRIENFRYRIRDGGVVLHERLHPSFAHIKPGDGDLFSLVSLEFVDDCAAFDRAVRRAVAESRGFFDLSLLRGRDDFVFFSSLPWLSFAGVDHTLSLKKDDGVPRATWGKFGADPADRRLPFNLQVNHCLVDGVHVGRFFAELDAEMAAFLA